MSLQADCLDTSVATVSDCDIRANGAHTRFCFSRGIYGMEYLEDAEFIKYEKEDWKAQARS